MRSIKLLSVIISLLVLGIGTAHAQSQVGGSAPLDVFVEVQGVCEVFTDPVAFPPYDPVAGSRGEGYIHVNCAEGLAYWIALDIGQWHVPDWDARGMVGPTGLILAYWLYNPFDGGYWGDAGMPFSTNIWDPLLAIGGGATETFPVLGEIPAGQAAEPGNYSDLVNVTIWY